jgi:hypothetical protein
VVADDFLDDEVQELFGEKWIDPGLFGQPAKARDLGGLTGGIGGGKTLAGLELAHRLGAFEALRQQMNKRRIDIVDAVSQSQKFWLVHACLPCRHIV